MPRTRQVWIGLVGVIPQSGSNLLEGAEGAYVNVLAWVGSSAEYRKIVKQELQQAGFKVERITDVEALVDRQREFQVDRRILRLAKEVERNHQTHCDIFYAYSPKRRSSKST